MSKILVVEDDSATRLLLKRDLQLSGYEVVVAKNGEEGLKQAFEVRPALILCDWMLPLMDGVEICRRLKATPDLASIFFILLTARGTVADRVEGLDAGADDFLSKPIDPNELLARVRAGLRLYRYQQQLSEANQQLSQALQELRQTQAQLVQSEKMSGLGQMVAGIAHEINNPITFISGNLAHTSEYVKDLLELMHLYQKHYPNPVVEVKRAAEEIDFEFVTRDLPKTLDSMQNGALRIRDIILSLRKFSRLDEAEMKKADIHEGLDNTLLILQHRLHRNSLENLSSNWDYSIEIIKEYDSLPLVECYPGQLNQVFFNLLNNALDALEKAQELVPQDQESFAAANVILQPFNRGRLNDDNEEERRSPTIKIRTRMSDENHIEIRICDNGSGMTPEVIGRLFDPFFTTKPVGSGTGLGLSICYQIVVGRHGGQLKCNSQLGVGTELVMQIPIRQFNDKKI